MSVLYVTACKNKNNDGIKTIEIEGEKLIDLNRDGQLQPYEDTRLSVKERVDDLMSRLSKDNKASLLIGTGTAGIGDENFQEINPVVGQNNYAIPGAAGTTMPLPEFGLPAIVMTDGPAGVRISPTRENAPNTYYATGFPVGTSLACTWDVDLVQTVGKAIGKEALEYGSDIQLAPALNIMRNPLCGRNYEYYSEDPLVSGKIAAALTNGIQSQNIGVSLKHFAANNNETNRMTIDVHVSQRALREIYLRGFEIAVKESSPRTIMSSYNKLNGTYTSASGELLTAILRDEWGFNGVVMTDWFGGYTGFSPDDVNGKDTSAVVAQLLAGNDLLMPGFKLQKDDILVALEDGRLTEDNIDINVRRILNMIFKSPKMKNYDYSEKPDLNAHARLTRRVATDAMVLLKNNRRTLPLSGSVKSVATFGMASYNLIAGGTGSGDVNKAYTISLKDGLTNAGYILDSEMEAIYKPYIEKIKDEIEKTKEKNHFAPIHYTEMALDRQIIDKKAQSADVAIVTIGRSTGEFLDRTESKGDFLLSDVELDLIRNVSEAFHAVKKKMIVVLNIGGVIEVDSWQNMADAILLAWLPGQEGGNAVTDILRGDVNPSGKLTMTFPQEYSDLPSASNFPGTPSMNPEYVDYKEGVYVGYRYFTSFDVKSSYEFGYGLSYSDFDMNSIKVSDLEFNGDEIEISINVKNTGKFAGKEVVQLYLSTPGGEIDKPVKELKAFAKTRLLLPGQSQTVKLILNSKDLASFYADRSAWIADAGKYKVEIGSSSMDIKQVTEFHLESEIEVEKVNNVLKNKGNFKDLTR